MRVEDHLLALARIGAHEQHPAVAKPHLRDLRHRRHAADDHALVAPVELVGLARLEGERDIGFCCPPALPLGPDPGIAAHIVVAALVPFEPKLVEQPLVGQTLALGPLRVGRQHRLECRDVGPELRHWLLTPLVAPLRLHLRPNDRADRVPRQPELAGNRLDLLLVDEMRAPDLRNRVHRDHPPRPRADARTGRHVHRNDGGVKIARRSPHNRGQNCMPVHSLPASHGVRPGRGARRAGARTARRGAGRRSLIFGAHARESNSSCDQAWRQGPSFVGKCGRQRSADQVAAHSRADRRKSGCGAPILSAASRPRTRPCRSSISVASGPPRK